MDFSILSIAGDSYGCSDEVPPTTNKSYKHAIV